MKTSRFLRSVAAAATVLAAAALPLRSAHAEQYERGAVRWNVKDGTLMLVSGVLSDNVRLRYRNYTLYLQADDHTLYLIPIVNDKKKLNDYSLSFSTFNGGEETITDALVTVKGPNVYLVTAHKDAVRGYNLPGVVTTKTYRLFTGGEAEWTYYFAPVAEGKYAEQQDYTVERALSETAKGLH
ncbi:hypothetical protein ACEPUD_30600 [Burkholderia ubonensis]|uniref:Lipoprotein n=1 Tax=Burkholderia ubonensis TaxID=101571 RepID=A0A117XIN1_9BURK|nr:hypothetical protein [Burkholderia ubonensis]KUZ77612.1 hypothetical protein WI35_05295 [Burkholderia ubonensis]KUZ83468.1 hypothetical protein WI38_27955 [Burkholderia ubonensis]KUZ95200.1 hypothetical protein WI39_14565 [Burkholderia ubonensis]KUZ97038.1 hypothetical protein WI40_16060 [Burkholderia ubonensis]